jgi:uncharacterized coiled-coil DUF342 family protein
VDDTDRYVERRIVADRVAAHQHAEHLRDRIEALALQIAESEDSLAEVYEEAARLRPHAAPRLREVARQARAYAEKERAFHRTACVARDADRCVP